MILSHADNNETMLTHARHGHDYSGNDNLGNCFGCCTCGFTNPVAIFVKYRDALYQLSGLITDIRQFINHDQQKISAQIRNSLSFVCLYVFSSAL